jgi:hypothetical protein
VVRSEVAEKGGTSGTSSESWSLGLSPDDVLEPHDVIRSGCHGDHFV